MKEACKLFEGCRDFRSFMGKHNMADEMVTRKQIDYIKIIKRPIPAYSEYSWPSSLHCNNDDYLFIDIYIKGSSFLYRQVSFQI